MWKLVIEDDEGKRTVVPLTREAYTLGRKEGNTIRLTERNVSRQHAKLTRRARTTVGQEEKSVYALEDIQSFNGVYVNGLRVAHAQELQHGDLIQIGDYRIILQDDAIADGPVTGPTSTTETKSTIPSGISRMAAALTERPNRLVTLVGPSPGTEYPLDKDRMTIGRAEDASISINHSSVSRLHCEVHALGDARFEIVDKGSSNGVRVNTTELKRGIIEPGDVIELGDVRFKFVGAGQIYRPGVTESQQLPPLGENTAAQVVAARKSSGSPLPYVLFAVVAGVGAAAAWVYVKPTMSPAHVAGAVSSLEESAEQRALNEARRLMQAGDLESAHETLNGAIADGSPLRTSADFLDIENGWADGLLKRADAEPDATARRGILARVAKATGVDAAHHKAAMDKLDELDRAQALAASPAASATRDASDAATVAARFDGGHRAGSTASTPDTTAAQPVATTKASDFEHERQLALGGDDSKSALKRRLEPKVYGGRASEEEARLLLNVCKDLHDAACVAQCRAILRDRQP